MSMLRLRDGVDIYYKDWGEGRPIVFHHAWALTADDWDPQMSFFMNLGYRVIAHDRRGHGRSSQTWVNNDMDTCVTDVAELMAKLDIRGAIHIGHSTGGGEVARYLARHGEGRVAKAVLISSVPPVMVKSLKNPGGIPLSVFDRYRAEFLADRSKMYRDIAIPFYGFNRPGVVTTAGNIDCLWSQGMMGCAKAHYDGIEVFSETDFTEDLEAISVPTLVLHGDDDQLVPFEDSGALSAKIIRRATLKVYSGYPHGMAKIHPDIINADLLDFIRD